MTSIRIVAILAASVALYYGASIFIPILGGAFLFCLLEPIVKWGEKKKVPRTLSSLSLVAISFIISGFLIWVLYGSVANVAREVPVYSKKISSLVKDFRKKADFITSSTKTVVPDAPPADDVQKVEVVGGELGTFTGAALRGLGTLFDVLAAAFFIPLIALFALWEKTHIVAVTKKTLSPSFDGSHIQKEMIKMLKAFFGGNLIIGFAMSVILVAVFSILGLQNSFSLGIIAGFLNLVPLVGPFISILLPLIAALLQFNSAGPFIVIVGVTGFLHLFITNFVIPKIVGHHVNVSATVSTIGLLVWGFLWGAVGLLLAVPIMAMIRIFLEAYPPTVKYARLFSGAEETSPVSR